MSYLMGDEEQSWIKSGSVTLKGLLDVHFESD